MVLPPRVSGRRRPVHRPLHVAEERLAGPTRAVTAPPVLPVHVHLVVEGVVNRDFRPAGLIDSVHVFAELRPVPVPVSVVLRDEQQGVDHLVQERLDQVFTRSEF